MQITISSSVLFIARDLCTSAGWAGCDDILTFASSKKLYNIKILKNNDLVNIKRNLDFEEK